MNWMTHLDVLLSESTTSEANKALRTLTNQLSSQPDTSTCLLERIFHPKASGFLNRLKENVDNEEFLLSALNCMDKTLQHYQHESRRENTKFIEASEAIGETLLQLLYQSRAQVPLAKNNSIALIILSILVQVTTCSLNFAQMHISELLGIARAHVSFGLQNCECNSMQIKPEKVQPSHQLSAGSSDELEADSSDMQKARNAAGGKVPKKRKPRSLTKSTAQNTTNQSNNYLRNLELNNIVSDIKTSDSDASASEMETNGGHANIERLNRAKVRQTAINLMGLIAARVKDRRILYAYWHGFLEISKYTNDSSSVRRDLPNTALHDPNSRCRALALQVLAQLIFNSKGFLQQAECEVRRCPTTFTHFAHNLGLQVLSLFDELTQVLSSESSLSVLTQALKCVAVLVQAMTPFKRFKPRDFVLTFVREVRRLTAHRDATIQVAALMVMEFLIDTPELTPEILQAIGMSHVTQLNNEKRINEQRATDLLEIDNSYEEILESDCEDNSNEAKVLNENVTLKNETNSRLEIKAINATKMEIPWLLHRALQNLNDKTSVASIAVRLESLQLLAAMAQHTHLLHTHLNLIATCIENAFKDTSIDLRLCGARTMDTIAHQIGRTLLETVTTTSDASATVAVSNMRPFEEECFQFWAHLLPVLIAQTNATSTLPPSALDTNTSIRVGLCDALSNIGLIIFERQPFTLQMNLIGFLSGIANDPNEEVILRVAAVRALAVYVLFPTLRDNLVFVENLAESVLRLVSDANLNVRVKSLWALGNISDALLLQSTNSHERVSDALLWHMITATTIACSDNDKVRCNAVRALGNLLRLLRSSNFETPSFDGQAKLQSAISKLIDCLRLAGSAKVKWNTCYAIGNLLQNSTLFHIQSNQQSSSGCNNFDWQSKLFPTLANVIVHNNNFKVRINAATALTHITARSHFGIHFEILCKSLLDAIEHSQNLDNFYEYNHRDHLQEQLCLATCHLLKLSSPDDFLIFRKHLESRCEIVRNINVRVVNRMVPEKSKGILACAAYLQQQLHQTNKINYTHEQHNAIKLIIKAFDNKL